jgi:predicted phosphodiesterase
MRAHVISDLHLEFLPDRIRQHRTVPTIEPASDARVLILAGDTAKKCNVLKAFANWPVPVIYVYGNHELYGAHLPKKIDVLRSASKATNIHFLERNEVVIDGVRFLCTALWNDFALLAILLRLWRWRSPS